MSGYSPKLWGRNLWHLLAIISYSYPENNVNEKLKIDMYNFFMNLGTILPCADCKDHYNALIPTLQLEKHLDSRASLSRFVYDLHNTVSDKIGSTSPRPTYEEVSKLYNSLRSENCSDVSGSGMCSGSEDLHCVVEIRKGPSDQKAMKIIENFDMNQDQMYMIIIYILVFALLCSLYYIYTGGKFLIKR
jgi:hypothetical protein